MALATNITEPMQRSEQFLSSGGTLKRFKNPSISEIDSVIEQINSAYGSATPKLSPTLYGCVQHSNEVLNFIKNMPPEYPVVRLDVAYGTDGAPVSAQVSYEVRKPTDSFYWLHTIWSFVENQGGAGLMRNLSVTYACWSGLDYRFNLYSNPNDIFKNGLTPKFDVTNKGNPSIDYETMMNDMKTNDPTSSGANWVTVPIALIQQASREILTHIKENGPNLYKVVDEYPPVPDLENIYKYDEDTRTWSSIS